MCDRLIQMINDYFLVNTKLKIITYDFYIMCRNFKSVINETINIINIISWLFNIGFAPSS